LSLFDGMMPKTWRNFCMAAERRRRQNQTRRTTVVGFYLRTLPPGAATWYVDPDAAWRLGGALVAGNLRTTDLVSRQRLSYSTVKLYRLTDRADGFTPRSGLEHLSLRKKSPSPIDNLKALFIWAKVEQATEKR